MNVGFGKHRDESVEILVLKFPDYVQWVLAQENSTGRMRQVADEIRRLITIFDQKPYTEKCIGSNCPETASLCTVYSSAVDGPMWWCDKCDPYQAGAAQGKIQSLQTYHQALRHSEFWGVTRTSLRNLIKSMSRAKGLARRVGENQAIDFFM